ncbi:LytTR family DNA-binding domain-containing protein [Paenibacillus rhizoplanae]
MWVGKNYSCGLTLTELEQRLLNFGFYRCHRSYIVNLQKKLERLLHGRRIATAYD